MYLDIFGQIQKYRIFPAVFSIPPFLYVTSQLLLSFQTLFYPLLSSLSFTFFSLSFFFIPNVPLPFHIFPYSSRLFFSPCGPFSPFLSHQPLSFPSHSPSQPSFSLSSISILPVPSPSQPSLSLPSIPILPVPCPSCHFHHTLSFSYI